jgi:hypothetical protein
MLRVGIIQQIIISVKNSVIQATDKQMYRISYISNKFTPQSFMYFNTNTEGCLLQ